MSTAEFMGFSRNSGLVIYKSVSLAANAYSIFGLFRRPGAWRLARRLLPEGQHHEPSKTHNENCRLWC